MNGITMSVDPNVCGLCSFAIDADSMALRLRAGFRRVKLDFRKLAIVIGINPAEICNVCAGESKTGNQLVFGKVQVRGTESGIVCPDI
jgi:hypothetical protein